MGMFGMGIGRMMVVMVMIVIMVVMMIVIMAVLRHQTAHTGAKRGAKRAIGHVGPWRAGALTFDMVVVAFLDRANLALKAQDLRAVFTQNAGGGRHRAKGGVAAISSADHMGLPARDSQNLRAIAADAAIGRRGGAVLFHDPFGKGF